MSLHESSPSASHDSAFNQRLVEYQPALERIAFGYVARYLNLFCDQTRDDVVQETLVIAMQEHGEYEERGRLLAWLRQICQNVCRKRGREMRLAELPADVPDDHDEPSAEDYVRFIRDCLKVLPQRLRTTIQLIYFRSLTYQEAATQMDEKVGTVKSRAHAARRQLAECVRQKSGVFGF